MKKQIIKKMMVAILLLMCSVVAFSQSEISEKKSKYGIYVGINHSNLMYGDLHLMESPIISNDLGFGLGVLADYKLTNWLSFSPKAELAFNSSTVNYSNGLGEQSYEVMPINVGIMGHLVVKKQNSKLSPYLFFGPQYRLSLNRRVTTTTEFGTNNDIALDIGIGLEKGFEYFNFAPELRYSYGFNNVNQNPAIPQLYFHNVSLIFNFLG